MTLIWVVAYIAVSQNPGHGHGHDHGHSNEHGHAEIHSSHKKA